MKSNWIIGLMLALPVTAFTACGSDDDTTTSNGGTGGANAGASGHAGNGGGNANGATGGIISGSAGGVALGGDGGFAEGGAPGGAGARNGEGGESGQAGAAAMLNDAEILKVVNTANDGEIAAAQAAKPGLQNSAVVSFAQMMIDEHTAANGQTLALVSSKQLAPEPSNVSESLEADTAALLLVLSKTAPATFDKVYIDSQVTAHQKVLTLLDGKLLPDATDPDVKALLGTIRASVVTHLSHAQTISASLP